MEMLTRASLAAQLRQLGVRAGDAGRGTQGPLGRTTGALLPAAEIVSFAVAWLEALPRRSA